MRNYEHVCNKGKNRKHQKRNRKYKKQLNAHFRTEKHNNSTKNQWIRATAQ